MNFVSRRSFYFSKKTKKRKTFKINGWISESIKNIQKKKNSVLSLVNFKNSLNASFKIISANLISKS